MERPVNFRPTEADQKVIDTIKRDHPLVATTDAAIIRLALSAYMERRNSIHEKLDELYRRMEKLEGKLLDG